MKIGKLSKDTLIDIGATILLLCGIVLCFPYGQGKLIEFGGLIRGRELHCSYVWMENIFSFASLTVVVSIFLFWFVRNDNKFTDSFYRFVTDNNFLFIICIIACLVYSCTSFICKDTWLDENFSMALVKHSFLDIVRITSYDFHPPLYYLILKVAVILFPGSIGVAKFVSVIPVVVILIVGVRFFLKEYTSLEALNFVLLVVASEAILHYAIEIRMYTWALLFVFLCVLCEYYIVKEQKTRWYVLYALSALCGAYSHYFAAFALMLNFVGFSIVSLIADKKNYKKVLLSVAISVLGYTPWISVLLRQMGQVYTGFWIEPINFFELRKCFAILFPLFLGCKVPIVIFTFVTTLITMKKLFMGEKNKENVIMLLNVFSPLFFIISAVSVELFYRPVFVVRYAFPSMAFLLVFLPVMLKRYVKKECFCALYVGLFFCCIVNSYVFIADEYKKSKYECWSSVKVAERLEKNSVYIINGSQIVVDLNKD